jgi:electron transfer flavoprotein beta subunit
MKICVCVKHVPDPTLSMRVDPGTRRLIRDNAKSILDPADEYGLEAALRLVEQHGGETVAVTMGPPAAEDALRRAMAMGADRSVHIVDGALAGSDVLGTARTLAAAIAAEQPDLVICATESTDAYSGMLPGALAALLGLPQVTFARSVTVEGSTIKVQRDTETGYQMIQTDLPALLTVTASIGEPRYPSFKGMMAAKKKPLDARDTETGYQMIQTDLPALLTVTASIGEPRYPSFKGMMAAKKKPLDARDTAALGLDGGTVGEAGARERVLAIEPVSQTKQTRKITDEGDGESVTEIVAFLKQIQVI